MTCVQLTASVMLNMLGAAIIFMPTKLAEIGTLSILSWIVTIIGATTISYVFSKCGTFSRRGGGLGGYSSYAFGKSGSFMANYTYAISLLIANLTIAISIVGYFMVLFGWSLSPVEAGVASFLILFVCSIPVAGGASIVGRLCNFSSLGILIPILFLATVGWHWFSLDRFIASWNPQNMALFDGVSAGISMTLWGFLGIEAAGANAEQVEKPEKSVPIAMLCSTVGSGVIYILATNIAFGIVDVGEIARSTAPFGLVFGSMFGDGVSKFVMGLMAVSCMGSLMSWQFTISEVFRSSSEQDYFPKIFSVVSRQNAPVYGIGIILAIQGVLAVVSASPRLQEQFYILKDIAVVTNLVPYLLVFSSVVVLMRHESVKLNTATRSGFAAAAASAYCLYALYACGANAVLWGALTTFAGFQLYGLAAAKLEFQGKLIEF
jgi:putrescine:ornithine antiporter